MAETREEVEARRRQTLATIQQIANMNLFCPSSWKPGDPYNTAGDDVHGKRKRVGGAERMTYNFCGFTVTSRALDGFALFARPFMGANVTKDDGLLGCVQTSGAEPKARRGHVGSSGFSLPPLLEESKSAKSQADCEAGGLKYSGCQSE